MKQLLIVLSTAAFAALLALNACTQESKQKESNAKTTAPKDIAEKGKELADLYCVNCHTATGNPDYRLAPPFIAVKDHYLEERMGEAEFVKSITEFLLSPTIENSKMPNAVKKFGLKLKLGYSKEEYEAIATYLYRTKMEKTSVV